MNFEINIFVLLEDWLDSKILKLFVICEKVRILCNDCGETSEVRFHTVALKCLSCKSYNTRKTQAAPCLSRMEEMVRWM